MKYWLNFAIEIKRFEPGLPFLNGFNVIELDGNSIHQ